MVNKRNTLGRGLGSLLNTKNDSNNDKLFDEIDIKLIDINSDQPRKTFDENKLKELSDSIKQHGIIQPITVRKLGNKKYQLISGERRFRASKLIGNKTIPAFIKVADDDNILELALIENIQREDLNPIEEALALKRLQDEFKLTQQEVADAVGRSRTAVTNLMRLVGLHIDVQKMLQTGLLEMGHARTLLTLPEIKQVDFARDIAKKGLSVRQTEELVRKAKSPKEVVSERSIDPNIKNLEESLGEKLGAKVLIEHKTNGKGRLIVSYNSLDELDGILAHLN